MALQIMCQFISSPQIYKINFSFQNINSMKKTKCKYFFHLFAIIIQVFFLKTKWMADYIGHPRTHIPILYINIYSLFASLLRRIFHLYILFFFFSYYFIFIAIIHKSNHGTGLVETK